MAHYQVIISNFHSAETIVWHTFTAQTEDIAMERFVCYAKEISLPFGRDFCQGDQAHLVRCVATKHMDGPR